MTFSLRSPFVRTEAPARRLGRGRRLALGGALALLGALLLTPLVPLAAGLGFLGPRTYLVLGQNPAELRPSGGFVGTYAELTVSFGRLVDWSAGDSFDLDGVFDERVARGELRWGNRPAPSLYTVADAPDFPTAARAAIDAYAVLTGLRPAGVIAVDPGLVVPLLDVTGPLTVRGESRHVTAENLVGLVLEHTQDFEDADADRKQFAVDLGRELLRALRGLPAGRWPELTDAVGRAADERHLRLYFADPGLQRLVVDRGWDGGLRPSDDDYLAVFEHNTGYNKANLFTERLLRYETSLEADGLARALLRVEYENRGSRSLPFSAEGMPFVEDADYEARVLVYVPRGSRAPRLNGDASDLQRGEDAGRTVFSVAVEVPAESRRAFELSYEIPPRRAGPRERYELLVQTQAGMPSTPIELIVRPARGWLVATPTVGLFDRDAWRHAEVLRRDARYVLTFRAPSPEL